MPADELNRAVKPGNGSSRAASHAGVAVEPVDLEAAAGAGAGTPAVATESTTADDDAFFTHYMGEAVLSLAKSNAALRKSAEEGPEYQNNVGGVLEAFDMIYWMIFENPDSIKRLSETPWAKMLVNELQKNDSEIFLRPYKYRLIDELTRNPVRYDPERSNTNFSEALNSLLNPEGKNVCIDGCLELLRHLKTGQENRLAAAAAQTKSAAKSNKPRSGANTAVREAPRVSCADIFDVLALYLITGSQARIQANKQLFNHYKLFVAELMSFFSSVKRDAILGGVLIIISSFPESDYDNHTLSANLTKTLSLVTKEKDKAVIDMILFTLWQLASRHPETQALFCNETIVEKVIAALRGKDRTSILIAMQFINTFLLMPEFGKGSTLPSIIDGLQDKKSAHYGPQVRELAGKVLEPLVDIQLKRALNVLRSLPLVEEELEAALDTLTVFQSKTILAEHPRLSEIVDRLAEIKASVPSKLKGKFGRILADLNHVNPADPRPVTALPSRRRPYPSTATVVLADQRQGNSNDSDPDSSP